MKLLIVTQKVNSEDPILGFFHRWIEEFAKHFEKVTVVCLEKGRHDLPENVKVLSMGKERRNTKFDQLMWFYQHIWDERKNYDVVFVHMNQIYMLLGGLMWKLMKKKITLWYTHKQVSLSLRVAEKIVDLIFTASKESFRLSSKKLRIMGHGIDIDLFCPDSKVSRKEWWLSVGRLMPSKRHDLAIKEAFEAKKELKIVGDGPERSNLEILKKDLNAQVDFLGSLTQHELRDCYRRAELLIHRSETGSMDKVVLEAASCGLKVDTTDSALSKLPLSPEFVKKNHSLPKLISSITKILTS